MTYQTRLLSLIFLLFWSLLALGRPPYDPKSLVDILEAVKSDVRAGVKPVVVFDLDDTLMDTGSRNVRIMQEFAASPEIQARYPTEAALLKNISLSNVQFLPTETLSALGITNKDFAKDFTAFWGPRFFSNKYCATDLANPGGASYVNALWNAGATIVYLTGRDEPGMKRGTEESLRRSGFPLGGESARLMLKPDKNIKDIDFKKVAFKEVQKIGHVVGAFENEPANVNAYLDAFKGATAVLLDTRSSQDAKIAGAVKPRAEIHWVKTFYGPWSVSKVRGNAHTSESAPAAQAAHE